MQIEIAYAKPERQILLEIEVDEGSTVGEVLARACASGELPAEAADLTAGVWGRVVEKSRRLRTGDRIELYRALVMDPREARRRYAESGATMSGPSSKVDPDL